MSKQYASVILDAAIEKPLDYEIPSSLSASIQPGSIVEVPLRGKPKKGYVLEIKDSSYTDHILSIISLSEHTHLPKELLTLALWMSRYYACSLSKVVKHMVPTAVREEIQPQSSIFLQSKKTKKELLVLIAALQKKYPAQALALTFFLKIKKGIFLQSLVEQAKISRAPLDKLIEKNILQAKKIITDETHLLENSHYFKTRPKKLSDEQQKALNTILTSIENQQFDVHLLFGVTGSGKTEVYMQAIEKVIQNGQSVIMLVPEIALTPQTIERFRSRFSNNIAIMHHKKSQGERFHFWTKLLNGETPSVIGARSAVFSPMKNLGLIIIDEEHDSSYKQTEEMPTYHARNVAIKRAQIAACPIILGSATPSIESFYNANSKKYILSSLLTRPTSATLPDIHIVDMKQELNKQKGFTHFSELLLEKIKDRHEKGEQVLLFLNRRGYHHLLFCKNCSHVIKCPHCDVSLTFHKEKNILLCHVCLHKIMPPRTCPECKKQDFMQYRGYGTEHVERQIKAIFPQIRTLRIDKDTTQKKHSHEVLFKEFSAGKADVLIGTQMIVKGLHFPSVSLVGVLHADQALNIPDFRSSEYVFQLLTQVAGRSGRSFIKGEVIIQTFLKEHPIIQMAKVQDYQAFYTKQLHERELFMYPPFNHLIKVLFSSDNEEKTFFFAETFRKELIKKLSSKEQIFPVIASGRKKTKDHFHFFFLVKGNTILTMTKQIQKVQKEIKSSKIKILIDVDPTSTFF